VDSPHITVVFSLQHGVTQVISSSEKKIKNLEKNLEIALRCALTDKKIMKTIHHSSHQEMAR
jgi:hypothetical protein